MTERGAALSWKRQFDNAIVLPDGRKLVTLLDAAIARGTLASSVKG